MVIVSNCPFDSCCGHCYDSRCGHCYDSRCGHCNCPLCSLTDPVDVGRGGRDGGGLGCVEHGDGVAGQAGRVCLQHLVPLHTRSATTPRHIIHVMDRWGWGGGGGGR